MRAAIESAVGERSIYCGQRELNLGVFDSRDRGKQAIIDWYRGWISRNGRRRVHEPTPHGRLRISIALER